MLTHANEASHPGDTWIGHPGVPASTVARGKAENPSIGFERRCNLTQTASHGMTGLTKKKTGISNPNTNSIPRYDWSARAWRSHPGLANEAMDVDWMGSQTCEPVPAKSCSWVTYVAAWGLSRDCTFLFEDGKRLSHNPLNVLLLCVGKTEYHVIRVCPEGGLHECALDGFRRSCRLQ